MPTEVPALELRFHVKSPHLKTHRHLFLARMIEDASKADPRTEAKLQVIERRLRQDQYSIYENPVLACLEDLDFFLSWVKRPTRIGKPESPNVEIWRAQKRIRSAPPETLLKQWRGRVTEPRLLAGKLQKRFQNHRRVQDVLQELSAGGDKMLVGHLNRFRNGVIGLTVGAAVVWLKEESRRRLRLLEPLIKVAAHIRNAKVSFNTIDRQVATRLPARIAKADLSDQTKYLHDLESGIVTEILVACIGALVRGNRNVSAYHCANKVLKPLLGIFWPEYAETAPGAALRGYYNSMRNQKL